MSRNVTIDTTPQINGIRAIQRYCANLVAELPSLTSDASFDFLYLSAKKKTFIPEPANTQSSVHASTIPGRILVPLWKLFNAPKISWWTGKIPDLVHFPGGLPYIPTNCQRILTTLHGFASRRISELIDAKTAVAANRNLDLAISKSTHFITVSEANKKELMEIWGVEPERVTPIPLGVSPEFKTYDLGLKERREIRARYGLPDKRFILFVGALEPHKNIKNIIIAYSLLPNSIRKIRQLVLVGKETRYCKEYRKLIASLGLTDNVSFVDYIQPGSVDLAHIYNMAELFVFPTFYEGWASPPLEAMRCGVPTVVSNIPSLMESTGGVSLYPDPNDPEAIADEMRRLLEDEELARKKIKLGLEFSSKLTWRRCAESTLRLYERILKN